MNLYISRIYRNKTTAGNKAKTDMEALMDRRGFRNISHPQGFSTSKVGGFFRNLTGVVKALFSMHKGDTLVLQYPMKKYFSAVCKVARLKGVRTVALIHDLGSFRRKALTPKKEIRRLSNADAIIAPNQHAAQWLTENRLTKPIHLQLAWDYLSDSQHVVRQYSATTVVCYAGSLGHRKNEFLYKWGSVIDGYTVNLYGGGFDKSIAADPEKFNDLGYVPSDELIATMQGNYGLIWDGDSIAGCTGNFGEYLAINNPHKMALYLRCGLPLIAWSQAGVADFILRQSIGFVVDSLDQIPIRLKEIQASEYQQYIDNVNRVADRISRGCYFYEVLERAGVVFPC